MIYRCYRISSFWSSVLVYILRLKSGTKDFSTRASSKRAKSSWYSKEWTPLLYFSFKLSFGLRVVNRTVGFIINKMNNNNIVHSIFHRTTSYAHHNIEFPHILWPHSLTVTNRHVSTLVPMLPVQDAVETSYFLRRFYILMI